MRQAIIVAVLVLCGTALGSDPQTGNANPTSSEVTYTGSLRLRVESWHWFDSSAGDPDYTFGAYVLRLGAMQKRSRFDWQLELEQPTLFGLPDHASAPAPQGTLGLGGSYFASNGSFGINAFPKQVFVRLHGANSKSAALKLGRFEFIDGTETAPKDQTIAGLQRDRIAHRLIGNFGFSHVGRSFDGVQFTRDAGLWNLTLMAVRPTRGVFNADGWGELDVDVQYAALTRAFQNSTAQWRLFGIGYHDGRESLKSDNRPAGIRSADQNNIRLGTVGTNLLKAYHTSSGTADFLLWGAWQFGQWGALSQRSGAIAAEAGYQWNVAAKPWVRAGYFRSTGDANPNDAEHGTFFQMLPTPRIYARFPFFNLMNNEDTFLELSLSPTQRLAIRSDAHVLRLSNVHDLWYSGGGAYEQTSFGYSGRPSGGSRALANLYDLSAEYQFTRHIGVTGYWGYAQGKTVIAKIYPQWANGSFAYIECLYKF